MYKCLYNGKIIYAIDVAKKFIDETEIRNSSKNNLLVCGDIDCKQLVTFKRGEHKKAHFAHRKSDIKCDYENYIKGKPSYYLDIKNKIFTHFRESLCDCKVDMDIKIISNHYTSILIETISKKLIAIEFGDKKTSSTYMQSLTEKYNAKNITVDWLILDIRVDKLKEKDAYQIKRDRINNSKNKVAFVLDIPTHEIIAYRLDDTEYSKKYGSIFFEYNNYLWNEKIRIEDITINDFGLYSKKVDEAFEKFKDKISSEIDNKIKEHEKARQIQMQRQPQPIIRKNNFKKTHLTEKNYNKPIASKEFVLDEITIPVDDFSQRMLINFEKQDFLEHLDKAVNNDETSIRNLIRKMCEANEREIEIFKKIYFNEEEIQKESDNGSKYMKVLEHVRKEAVKLKEIWKKHHRGG